MTFLVSFARLIKMDPSTEKHCKVAFSSNLSSASTKLFVSRETDRMHRRTKCLAVY